MLLATLFLPLTTYNLSVLLFVGGCLLAACDGGIALKSLCLQLLWPASVLLATALPASVLLATWLQLLLAAAWSKQ